MPKRMGNGRIAGKRDGGPHAKAYGNGRIAGKRDGGPHAKAYGKWTNSR